MWIFFRIREVGILTTLAEAGGGRHFFLILWVLADANGRDKRWTELLGYPKSIHTTWICVFFLWFFTDWDPMGWKKTSRPTIWGKIFGSLFQKIMASREWIQVFLAHFFFVYIYIYIYYNYIYIYTHNLLFLQNFPRSQYHNFQCSPALPLTSPSKPCLFFFWYVNFTVLRILLPLPKPNPWRLNETRHIWHRASWVEHWAMRKMLWSWRGAGEPSATVAPIACTYCLFFFGMLVANQIWVVII